MGRNAGEGRSPGAEEVAPRAPDYQRYALDTIARNATAALFVADGDGRPTFMNPAAEAMIGYTLDEIRGIPLHDVIHHHRPDGTPYPKDECPSHRALPEHAGVLAHEDVFFRRDGSAFPASCAASPILEQGVPVAMVIELRDITAERRAQQAIQEEAELVATLQRIGTLLAGELDLERIVQTVTDESTRLTGAQFGAFFYNVLNDRGESYTLYTISGVPREAFSRFPMPRNTQIFEPTFRGTSIMRSDDITKDPRYGLNPPYHGMPAGHLPVVSYLAVPVVSHTGEVLGGLFFGHESPGIFTERDERLVVGMAGWASVAMDNARLYASERRARSEAERANRAKSEFLATMSHELRTPLNAIGGYAELLELGVRGPVSDEQRADLHRIIRAQRHLLSLINDVLNFAKLEAGHVAVEPREVPVLELITDLHAMVAPQLEAKGIAFIHVAQSDRLAAHADPEKARQILLNLVSNAIKFTTRGGTISIETDVTDARVRICVRDTGIGIPSDRLEDIFAPFVQIDRGLTRAHEGTGLGLAISRDLARAMGGDLTATSRLGHGSAFTLTLPLP